jgi:hypothetical protein
VSATQIYAREKMSRWLGLFAFGMLAIVPATSRAQQSSPLIDIAKAYGLDSFGQIEAIRYTLHAEFLTRNITRSWEWSPKTDTVSYESKDKDGKEVKLSYKRSELPSQTDAIKAIDPAFIVDQYWILLAVRLAWDGEPAIDEGAQKLPLSDGTAQRIVVKYPEVGYQPGDIWDLYVGPDKRIQQLTYHRGSNTPPPKIFEVAFEDYKKAGPLLVATAFRGPFDGKPGQILLSNISVKLTGSDNWISAQ